MFTLIVLLMLERFASAADQRSTAERGESVRACGRVVSVKCSPDSVTFLVDVNGRDLLVIDTDAIADREAVRSFIAGIPFRRVCVAGRPLNRGDAFTLRKVGMDALDNIELLGDSPSPDPLGAGVYRSCESGITMPTVIRDPRPTYPEVALRAGGQGTVWLEALIGVDGRVTKARVLQSLDQERGLDDEAISTVTRWRFNPAMKEGQPVPIAVTFELTRGRPPRQPGRSGPL